MAAAGLIAVLDEMLGVEAVLTGLLVIPPLVAAARCSLPETALVGVVCIALAVLSSLWNQNFGSTAYVVEALTVIAGVVAALWLSSLRADLNREQQAAELVAESSALMEDALDMTERAHHLAELAVPALGEVAMVDLLDGDGSIVSMAATSRGSEVGDLFLKLRATVPIRINGAHPVAEVIRTGEPLLLDRLTDQLIDEITTHPEERELIRRHRFQSALVLPLKARGSVLGSLSLWIMRPGHVFDRTARSAAGRLAQRAALSLDNARLHEQQAHIAGVLQHSLLPRVLPEMQGFEIASRFLAAGEASEVGGDFYDAFRTGSQSWTVVIGDVCGKGPEAAALTSLARHTVRAASDPQTPPSAVLRALHDSIADDRTDLRFCTAALLRVDPPENGTGAARITVSLGGHPPPLALRRDGSVDAIGEPGTLLGALSEPTVSDVSATLEPGETLVLYTDGMLDARDREHGDDPAWLAEQLSRAGSSDPEEIAEKLTEAALGRHGGNARDDIAVIVLRRTGG